jgi:cyclophilin family peptidyl-prolyl cis-trans isomerase
MVVVEKALYEFVGLIMKIVTLETTSGIIKLKLFPKRAPKTCFNFMELIRRGLYDGTIFHRVIPNFMIQGGKIEGVTSVYGKGFEDEISGEVNFARPGVLAMANQGKGTNTNGSQFFLTTIPTEWLNMNHTIFGEIFGGFDTVNKIAWAKRNKGDKPIVDQKIIKAYMEVV